MAPVPESPRNGRHPHDRAKLRVAQSDPVRIISSQLPSCPLEWAYAAARRGALTTTADVRAEHAEWKLRRLHRINLLCQFLDRTVLMAVHENDAAGWYSRHVIWALHRLEQLDYRFPEVEDHAPRYALTLAEVIAA
jgi:hypothetical protein